MACKSVICLTISFNVASLVGLIHTKQTAERQTLALELYLIVHALKASVLHYTSKHGLPWHAWGRLEADGLRDPDRVAERLLDGRRDLDLCYKKLNTQMTRWCQTIKRLHNKHEGSQRKLQTCAFRYLQSSKTDMLNRSKTVACQEFRRPSPPARPQA